MPPLNSFIVPVNACVPEERATAPSQLPKAGLGLVPQHTPASVTGEAPSAKTSPPTHAVPFLIVDTSFVLTVGNSLSRIVWIPSPAL